MLRIERQDGSNLTLVAEGRLRAEDYDRVLPSIERQISEHGPLRALLDVQGLEGLEPQAWIEEAKFDVKHRDDFARCAVLGAKCWERLATRLAGSLFRGEVRYFDPDHADAARHWVES